MRRLLKFKLVRYTLLASILLLVMAVSAVTAMRFAIHGREVFVPNLVGQSRADAERLVAASGLILSIDDRFFSPAVPEGSVVSQLPAPGSRVRRGARVRMAVSLGPARAQVPDLTGQSRRAAEINVQRRGLDLGEVSTIVPPPSITAEGGQVLAQSPPPGGPAASPRINLLVSADNAAQEFLMPDLTGRHLADVAEHIQKLGFQLRVARGGQTETASAGKPLKNGKIVKQTPAAGKRIRAKEPVTLEVQ